MPETSEYSIVMMGCFNHLFLRLQSMKGGIFGPEILKSILFEEYACLIFAFLKYYYVAS